MTVEVEIPTELSLVSALRDIERRRAATCAKVVRLLAPLWAHLIHDVDEHAELFPRAQQLFFVLVAGSNGKKGGQDEADSMHARSMQSILQERKGQPGSRGGSECAASLFALEIGER